ncbi:MAG: ankyrin repeat domain-containing protein [Planctomycetota bacterium]|jgi:ankyrin repeat protein
MRSTLYTTLACLLLAGCAQQPDEGPAKADPAAVEQPLKKEAEVAAPSPIPVRTALHDAAKNGDLELAKHLIRDGAEIDAREKEGHTPLHEAARAGHLELVKLLIGEGADVEAKCEDNATPLYAAALDERVSVVEGTLTWGGGREIASTPLHSAVHGQNVELIGLLLSHGADTNAKNGKGETPLHQTARQFDFATNLELARLLVRNGADVNAKDGGGQTPLHNFARLPDFHTAELLVAHGADVSAKDNHGRTPLHAAPVAFTNIEVHRAAGIEGARIAELLIKKGADVTARNRDGDTPLHVAAEKAHLAVMKMLLARDVDIGARGKDGDTPLRRAARSLAAMKLLIDAGADVNAKNDGGATPLHLASWYDHEGVLVEYLVGKGADVTAADTEGITPLHHAARNGIVPVAELLIDKGAKVNAQASDGRTPRNHAFDSGKFEFVKLLDRRGAKRELGRLTVAQFEAKQKERLGARLFRIEGSEARVVVALDPVWALIEAFTGQGLWDLVSTEGIDEFIAWKLNAWKLKNPRQGAPKGAVVTMAFARGLGVEGTTALHAPQKFPLMRRAARIILKEGVDSPAAEKLIREIVALEHADSGASADNKMRDQMVESIAERVRGVLNARKTKAKPPGPGKTGEG